MLGRTNGFDAALAELQAGGAKPWLDRVLKKKIVVHQKSGLTIEGVLMERTEDGIILRAAVLLGDDGSRKALAGENWVPRENVAFAQLDD